MAVDWKSEFFHLHYGHTARSGDCQKKRSFSEIVTRALENDLQIPIDELNEAYLLAKKEDAQILSFDLLKSLKNRPLDKRIRLCDFCGMFYQSDGRGHRKNCDGY